MIKGNNKKIRHLRRRRRVRAKISGTAKIPRLSVFRSIKNIYVQIIDDGKGVTLASASLSGLSDKATKNNVENAGKVGKVIAEKCGKIKIDTVVFDRNGYKYHGKVKALAEAARKAGLKF